MDWTWFRGAILHGTFDPTAFEAFTINYRDQDGLSKPQEMTEIIRAIRQNSESGREAFGLPDPKGQALATATRMANWTQCALPFEENVRGAYGAAQSLKNPQRRPPTGSRCCVNGGRSREARAASGTEAVAWRRSCTLKG